MAIDNVLDFDVHTTDHRVQLLVKLLQLILLFLVGLGHKGIFTAAW